MHTITLAPLSRNRDGKDDSNVPTADGSKLTVQTNSSPYRNVLAVSIADNKAPQRTTVSIQPAHLDSAPPSIDDWKKRVAASFDRAAYRYDESAGLQKDVVARLVRRLVSLPLPPTPRILEIGCGTGLLTRALRQTFPRAQLTITDISISMVKRCRHKLRFETSSDAFPEVEYVCMDGEHLALNGHFDLICSSLAVQWFVDLEQSMRQLTQLLAAGGHLAYSTLGSGTFREWIEAHRALGIRAGTPDYPTVESLQSLWPTGGLGRVEADPIRRHYSSARVFLNELKRIGANTPANDRPPARPARFRRLLRSLERPEGLCVTYNIVYGVFTVQAEGQPLSAPGRGGKFDSTLAAKRPLAKTTAARPPRAVRAMTEQDVPILRRFLHQQIAHNNMGAAGDEDYYWWKFFSCPESFCFGAFVHGKLVGFLGRVCRPFFLEGHVHLTTEGTDAFVSPEHQGTGLFQRLIVAARVAVRQAGVAFSIARPNHNSGPGARHAGHKQLCQLQILARPLGARFLVERATERPLMRTLLARPSQWLLDASLWPHRVGQLLRLRTERLHRFDHRMDALWERAKPRFRAGIVHDRRYMNWRYIDCPLPYQTYGLLRDDKLLGVAVAKMAAPTPTEPAAAEIVDLLTVADDPGLLAYLLLGRILSDMASRGAEVARCALPSNVDATEEPLRSAMRAHGFVPRPSFSPLLVRAEANAEAAQVLIHRGHWNFRGGDSDYA